jgi:nucleotide-binding universal stress UspA family protein
MYEHLLVALDGAPESERVLDHAEAIARAFRSRVTVLRATISAETLLAETAGTGPAGGDMGSIIDPTPILEIDRESAEEYLDTVANRLRAEGLTVETEHPEGDAATEIVERANALGVSMIVMSTHARGGLGRVLFGSVADSVVRHAACPVLLVRVTSDGQPEKR